MLARLLTSPASGLRLRLKRSVRSARRLKRPPLLLRLVSSLAHARPCLFVAAGAHCLSLSCPLCQHSPVVLEPCCLTMRQPLARSSHAGSRGFCAFAIPRLYEMMQAGIVLHVVESQIAHAEHHALQDIRSSLEGHWLAKHIAIASICREPFCGEASNSEILVHVAANSA